MPAVRKELKAWLVILTVFCYLETQLFLFCFTEPFEWITAVP